MNTSINIFKIKNILRKITNKINYFNTIEKNYHQFLNGRCVQAEVVLKQHKLYIIHTVYVIFVIFCARNIYDLYRPYEITGHTHAHSVISDMEQYYRLK